MKHAAKRTVAATKQVAADRKDKLPRPIKRAVVCFHEDEKGKPTKQPHLIREYKVAVGPKTCIFVDSRLNEHRFPLEDGDIDYSSGQVAVKETEFDFEGNVLCVTNLSHEVQYAPDLTRGSKTSFTDHKIAFKWYQGRQQLLDTPNAVLSRFIPNKKDRAGILNAWQAQADAVGDNAEDWVDGKKPTQEQMVEKQKAYEAKKNKTNADDQTEGPKVMVGPDGIDDVPENTGI